MNINSAFPSNYIKASDLNESAVVVTIREIKVEQVGRDKDTKLVAYFQGKEKGLVLNKTNARKIAEITGSQDTDDWPGSQIMIYPTETEFAGESVECIRVKAPSAAKKKAVREPEPVPVTREPGDDDINF